MIDSPISTILGQPKVRDFLSATINSGSVGQAYLFLGPQGSNKTNAAYAFASAILENPNLEDIKKGIDPDVKFYKPNGANSYLIDQIKEIQHDILLAPIVYKKKIYIIDRADMLGASCANAFLKTLEEPPSSCIFILLGRTRESVLPTIVSRCINVPFEYIKPALAIDIICQNTGANKQLARCVLDFCNNSISNAIDMLGKTNNSKILFRQNLINDILNCSQLSNWEICKVSKKILEDIKVPNDNVIENNESKQVKDDEFLSAVAKKQIEQSKKRALTVKSKEILMSISSCVISILQDMERVILGNRKIVNFDFGGRIDALSNKTNLLRIEKAKIQIANIRESINYNISSESYLNSILFEYKRSFND